MPDQNYNVGNGLSDLTDQQQAEDKRSQHHELSDEYVEALAHIDGLIKLLAKMEIRTPWDIYTLDDMYGQALRVARQSVVFHQHEHLRMTGKSILR